MGPPKQNAVVAGPHRPGAIEIGMTQHRNDSEGRTFHLGDVRRTTTHGALRGRLFAVSTASGAAFSEATVVAPVSTGSAIGTKACSGGSAGRGQDVSSARPGFG